MMNNCNFKVGVYIRLSKEDLFKEKNKESESIKNQRKLIYRYLKEHNLSSIKEYVDDGYSGTNFNRPAFNQLLHDIKNNKINMIITKDLSRLGRDYIKTGYYVENYFPTNKIRYVSILDGIDTYYDTGNNDIAPFKALFNDMVSKDTSKKIKSILKTKKEQGLFLGSRAPYGYVKDPNNKNKLIIDQDKANIVKQIFSLSFHGKSNKEIAIKLNNQNILSPTNQKWTASSIYNILNNKEYTGCLVSNVWTNVSYKNKTRIKRNQQEWVVINNTQEKIISEELFEIIQSRKRKKGHHIIRNKLLLEGLVYCLECGSLLGVSYSNKRKQYIMTCNTYRNNSSNCTSHYINYQKLEEFVLNRINNFLSFIINNQLLKQRNINNNQDIQKIEKKLKYLYEDRLNEIIDVETYLLKREELQQELKKLNQLSTNNVYDNIYITRELLFSLINKITISRNKQIKIIYNFSKL